MRGYDFFPLEGTVERKLAPIFSADVKDYSLYRRG